jgi:hypothetical protein
MIILQTQKKRRNPIKFVSLFVSLFVYFRINKIRNFKFIFCVLHNFSVQTNKFIQSHRSFLLLIYYC